MGVTVEALGLVSGGLDSTLAARLLEERGVAVRRLHLRTGFGRATYEACLEEDTKILDVSERYLEEVVLAPKHGVGSGMNPCIDCRVFMLREAERVARRLGIDLLFTGEVVGQRAFDQSRAAMEQIEKLAGVEGRLLRPLCAGLMPETAAEREGRIGRAGALRIHGSSRRAQLDLARRYGLPRFPTPSGGCCRLAEKEFARILRDFLAHRPNARVGREEIELLKRGRHFRLDWQLKVVVGRHLEESRWLRENARGRATCQVASGKGTFAVLDGVLTDARIQDVVALAARYSAERAEARVEVVLDLGGERRRLLARPAPEGRLEQWRI